MVANFAKPFWQAHRADAYGYCSRPAALKSEANFAFAAALVHARQDHMLLHIANDRLPAIVRVDMLDFDEDRLGRVEGRRRAAGRVADPQVQACYGQMSRRVPKSDAVNRPRD
jgi:hypothetical protein